MVKTLLCDLGNVLVYFCHDRMCRQIGALCGRGTDDVRRVLLDSELQWTFERGMITEQEFHQRLEAAFHCHFNHRDLLKAASDIFVLNVPMVNILDQLKAQGIRLVLFSNTTVSHYEFVQLRFDLLSRFDEKLLSYEVGAIKPEAGMFEAALRTINCLPAECLYVDDISRYSEAAKAFGFDAWTFTNPMAFAEQLHNRGVTVHV